MPFSARANKRSSVDSVSDQAGSRNGVLRDGAARLLRMTTFLNAIKSFRHPEEPAQAGVSKDATTLLL
jgi:hypothetical protein